MDDNEQYFKQVHCILSLLPLDSCCCYLISPPGWQVEVWLLLWGDNHTLPTLSFSSHSSTILVDLPWWLQPTVTESCHTCHKSQSEGMPRTLPTILCPGGISTYLKCYCYLPTLIGTCVYIKWEDTTLHNTTHWCKVSVSGTWICVPQYSTLVERVCFWNLGLTQPVQPDLEGRRNLGDGLCLHFL